MGLNPFIIIEFTSDAQVSVGTMISFLLESLFKIVRATKKAAEDGSPGTNTFIEFK